MIENGKPRRGLTQKDLVYVGIIVTLVVALLGIVIVFAQDTAAKGKRDHEEGKKAQEDANAKLADMNDKLSKERKDKERALDEKQKERTRADAAETRVAELER